MLKFDVNDFKALGENAKQKLILTDNNYKGNTFRADLKGKTIKKSKLRIIKANNWVIIKISGNFWWDLFSIL